MKALQQSKSRQVYEMTRFTKELKFHSTSLYDVLVLNAFQWTWRECFAHEDGGALCNSSAVASPALALFFGLNRTGVNGEGRCFNAGALAMWNLNVIPVPCSVSSSFERALLEGSFPSSVFPDVPFLLHTLLHQLFMRLCSGLAAENIPGHDRGADCPDLVVKLQSWAS